MLGEFLGVLACDPPVSAQSGPEDLCWFTVDEVVPSVGVYGFTNELFLVYSTPSGDLTVSS